MNAPCDIIRDLLPLYVDGALSDTSAELVREHLRECHPCRLNYRQLKPVIKTPAPSTPNPDAEYTAFLRRLRSRRITMQAATAAVITTLATLTIITWGQKKK